MARPCKPAPWAPPSPLPGPIETARLRIGIPTIEDAPGLYEAVEADRPSLLPWLPWAATENRTVAACEETVRRFASDAMRPDCTSYVMSIYDRTTGALLGGTGLHAIQHESHQAEIGYWVRGDRVRQGICTEAVRALLEAALCPQAHGGWGLRRIEIFCAGSNLASQAIPRKLGLEQEVHKRAHRWIDGIGWDDTLGWGITLDEAHENGHPA